MATRQIPLTAHYVARTIDLVQFAQRVPYALVLKTRNHYLFKIQADQWFLVYSFGVVVLVGVSVEFLKKVLTKKVRQCCTDLLEDKYLEEYTLIEDQNLEREGAEFEVVKIKKLTPEKVEIIAEILAQSVAIDALDHQAEHMIGQFSGYTTILEQRGRLVVPGRAILKLIGQNYGILESTITRLSLLDRPDIIWEDAELEHLFESLRSMFELGDRFTALDFKLKLIQSHSLLFLDVLAARRTERLEIIIIILIALEVILFIYELFGRQLNR